MLVYCFVLGRRVKRRRHAISDETRMSQPYQFHHRASHRTISTVSNSIGWLIHNRRLKTKQCYFQQTADDSFFSGIAFVAIDLFTWDAVID